MSQICCLKFFSILSLSLVVFISSHALAQDPDELEISTQKIQELISGKSSVPAQSLLEMIDEAMETYPDKYQPQATCEAGGCTRVCPTGRRCSCVAIRSSCHCTPCR